MPCTHNVCMTLCDYLTKDRLKCITIVLASSMIISINNGIMYVPGIYVPYWREEMNASRFELDFIGSLQMGFAFCQGPFLGYLIRRFGYRIISAIGGTICAISFTICSFTVHISMLYIFYGVFSGLGIGMLYMSAVVAVTTNFDEKRPIAMGIVTCGTGLGVSSMSFFIPLLLKKTGWRSSMYILSGLSICLALFGACLISRKNQKHRSSSTYFTDVLPRGIFEDVQLPVQLYGSTRELNSAIKLTDLVDVRYGHHLLGNLGSYFYMTQINQIHLKDLRKKKKALSLLIIPEYDLYLAGMLLLSCVFIVPFIFIYDWLTIKGFSANQISIVLLMNGVFGGFSRLLIGFVSNMKCSKVVIILLFCLGISGILSISCTYFNEPWQYAIYSAIDGICCGAYSVLQPLVLVEILSRDHITQGLGILLFVCGLGYLFGVPILAMVYDQWKSYELCYRICGIVCLIASGLVFTMWMLSYRKVRLEIAELKLKQNLERSYQLYGRRQTDSSTSTIQLKDIE